jgi:hypothetical protein
MNASQMIAWFICLGLALAASLLGIRNTAKLAMLEGKFDRVQQGAKEQSALRADVDKALRQIEQLTRARAPEAASGAAGQPPAPGSVPVQPMAAPSPQRP